MLYSLGMFIQYNQGMALLIGVCIAVVIFGIGYYFGWTKGNG